MVCVCVCVEGARRCPDRPENHKKMYFLKNIITGLDSLNNHNNTKPILCQLSMSDYHRSTSETRFK